MTSAIYDKSMFQELSHDEMMSVDGGFLVTLAVGAGYALVKIGGITVAKFFGAAALKAAIMWATKKGLDYVFE